MDISAFLAVPVIGALLALIIEGITNKLGTNSFGSKAVAIALSILVGWGYWYFSSLAVWQSILSVLAAASTVWALFINKGSKPANL